MSKIMSNIYEIGDTVYLKTDEHQLPRIVFCFKVYENDLLYELVCGTVTSAHYYFEISKEKNVLINA
jgi:hypothetical protein